MNRKGIVGALLVGAALRLASLAGAGDAVGTWVKQITADGSLVTATLSLELGRDSPAGAAASPAAETAPPEESAAAQPEADIQDYVQTLMSVSTPAPTASPESTPQAQDGGAAAPLSGAVSLRNDTDIDVDLDALAAEGLAMELQAGQPQVLIVHTHSSEAYKKEAYDTYAESDTDRTEDPNYSVIRVGDELTKKLESCGMTVIHDRNFYDYPSYTGSYTRSGAAVEETLKQYPSIKIVIDLHRDAVGSGDAVYKTQAEVSGISSAQVMLLVGTGENGLYHPYWKDNLKLAMYMQNAMDGMYPSLARPIALKKERYNQQLTRGSLILEVGSTGNTLTEALAAIDLFGDSVGPALAKLIV